MFVEPRYIPPGEVIGAIPRLRVRQQKSIGKREMQNPICSAFNDYFKGEEEETPE